MSPEPVTVSWTQLRAHSECKQKAMLLRTGKRNPATNIRNYFHGMVVDHAMRRWLAMPGGSQGLARRPMTDLIDEAFEEVIVETKERGGGVVRWRDASDRQEVHQFCVELVTNLEPILQQYVVPYVFDSAKWFKVAVTVPYFDNSPATVFLRGEMDLFVTQDINRYVVWDLKGTKDDNYWRKVIGQLVFYDLAVLALYGRPTEKVGLIQPMCTQPIIEFAVTEDQRRQMWASIMRMVEDIWRQDVACRDDVAACTRCEVRHACPRFSPSKGNTVSFGQMLREAHTGVTG